MIKIIALVGVLFLFAVLLKLYTDKLFDVIRLSCEADEALHNWRMTHPQVYLGLSDTGKALLTHAIHMYDQLRPVSPVPL